jgi:hypothetical protein
MLPLWFRSLARKWSRAGAAPARRPLRPLAEALEDRLAPAVLHWTGAVSAVWSTAGNWAEAAVPQADDTVVFDTGVAGFTRFTSTNDIAGLTLGGLSVADSSTAGDFTINGNAVTLTGGITNASNGTSSLNLTTITAGNDITLVNAGGTSSSAPTWP